MWLVAMLPKFFPTQGYFGSSNRRRFEKIIRRGRLGEAAAMARNMIMVHLPEQVVEQLDLARQGEGPLAAVAVFRLRLLQQHLEQRVVDVIHLDHEPLLLRPYVDGEATFRCHQWLLRTPFGVISSQRMPRFAFRYFRKRVVDGRRSRITIKCPAPGQCPEYHLFQFIAFFLDPACARLHCNS